MGKRPVHLRVPRPGLHRDIAVIIPAFKQPGFLPEAIASVLAQRSELKIAAVVVDDGCPMPGTREAGMAFARRHPGRVFYLRRRNGGLSAARNTGIDFALAAWPECRALYFLDADNRLHPDFLQRAWDVLAASPRRSAGPIPTSTCSGSR
ncbi:glycosyltransferase family 2 protein [Pseudoroseomonas wenyumeiae]